jgi:hypothetical protein
LVRGSSWLATLAAHPLSIMRIEDDRDNGMSPMIYMGSSWLGSARGTVSDRCSTEYTRQMWSN